MPRAKLKPPPTADPEEFWLDQFRQAVADVNSARKKAPSVVPNLVRLQREAWGELQAARSAKKAPQPAPTAPGGIAGTSLEDQLAETRRMRLDAQNTGKLTAAEKLLRREGELAEEIRRREEEAAKKARAGRSAAEVIGALASRINAMPDAMKSELRARLGW